MLVVRPNKRRMRRFRDSPSENSIPNSRGSRVFGRPRGARVFLAASISVAVVLGVIVLSGYVRF